MPRHVQRRCSLFAGRVEMSDNMHQHQLTTEQAIAFHDMQAWKLLNFKQRAILQLEQEKLCMPMAVFMEALERTLGRKVYTHELGTGTRDAFVMEVKSRPEVF